MKYIKNTMSYDMTLKIKDKEGNEQEFGFPCFRRYSDTGNVYSSGVTALEDEDVEELKKNKQFNKLLHDREFMWTDKSAMSEAANDLEKAEKENKALKAENEKLKKEAADGSSEELKKALAENEELKQKLELIGKAGKSSKDKKGKEEPEDTGDSGETGGF